ncbi:MAG TPA: hypothetical protein EYO90_02735 [Candidatus Latescibacteria bacterium]|nr:hypothetical protein [Candidatus Latescibacterota bacterium]
MAERHPEPGENPKDESGEAAESVGIGAMAKGRSRRDFIKKLPYIAPVVETFLLSETVYAKGGGSGMGNPSPGRGMGMSGMSGS